MMRWDIINHLIKKNNYKNYLEIGYYKGWSFDRIEGCETMTAVDPNPCKNSSQEASPYGSIVDTHIIKMTSDEFFAKEMIQIYKWDIIFIDGLHEATQVSRDIENSLKHLAEGGTIVLHDCNPPKYEHTTVGIDGCWTGDTWKAAVKFRATQPHDLYTVDTDWGVGVITPSRINDSPINPLVYLASDYWPEFDEHRVELLNLISPEEFLKRETTTDINLPA